MMRVKVLGIGAVLAAGLGLATSAKAADLSFDPFEQSRGEPLIELAAGGCGPGFHPNPWGHCRRNDRGYGYGGARRFYEGRHYGYGDGYGRGVGYDYHRRRPFYDGD
ncbi:hypothetical protein MKK58_04580 [Methylobacterium sp. J-078]|uniref:GCG_CRPN prefix-to-repeats domain-containing protein n=1 Tax=Methylobacterium sp. J-078 TaxID=2836657 RepID=UPI001FBAB714|nr:hypothetical protein [Methylobacterium sp. J-078]MCJ2043813.1 hypothetical protein [Methylobacterium sp. J-078]